MARPLGTDLLVGDLVGVGVRRAAEVDPAEPAGDGTVEASDLLSVLFDAHYLSLIHI